MNNDNVRFKRTFMSKFPSTSWTFELFGHAAFKFQMSDQTSLSFISLRTAVYAEPTCN